MRLVLSALAVVALVGCAITPQDIEGVQGSNFTVHIPAPPAVAYRHLMTGMRDCYSDKAWKIDADYFPDVQRGRVTFGASHASITLAIVNLGPERDGTSMKVSYYDPRKRADADAQWRRSFVPWAQGVPGYCVVDSITRPPTSDPARLDR
jgi:hypothetical protein